jgi:hypothetical protein
VLIVSWNIAGRVKRMDEQANRCLDHLLLSGFWTIVRCD